MSEQQSMNFLSEDEKLREACKGLKVELITTPEWHARAEPKKKPGLGYNRPPGKGGEV